MEIHCLFCHKTVDQTPGKRQKNFCNTSCRSMYWQQNKRVPKTVQRVTYDKVVAENNALREENDRLKERLQTFEGNPESEQSQKIKKHIEGHELTPKKPDDAPALSCEAIKKMAKDGASRADVEMAMKKAKPKLTSGQEGLIRRLIQGA